MLATSLSHIEFLMASRSVMTDEELAALDALIADVDAPIWLPLPNSPQQMAYDSIADVIGMGGAAGGGKTDLILGKSLNQHRRIAVFRVNGTEHEACIDRLEEILGTRVGFNGQKGIWRKAGPRQVQVEFLSIPNMGDEQKYRGRPHDLKAFDEVSEMVEFQVRFLLGWLRTTVKGQRCQGLLTFNPPTSAEGRWIIDFFAPWLDPKHRNPAQPGELRYFVMLDGVETEIDDARPFVLINGEPFYDFDPNDYVKRKDEILKPQSRTFIPARVSDNPYLVGTNYMTQLQSLPEPLRSQLLYGDFQAGMEDDAMQVIPTAWIDAAMARWKPRSPKGEMMSVGIDVARGGKDETIIARRHKFPEKPNVRALWFDVPLAYPGTATPDGPTVAGLTIAATRDNAPQHIDIIGVGASPYDFLNENNQQVIGVNVSEMATATDKSGMLRFSNQRSQDWWMMREALDPSNDTGIELPPDKKLATDLAAPKWRVKGKVIQVESRDEIVARIKRSPDRAAAYLNALRDTPKMNYVAEIKRKNQGMDNREYDPYKAMEHDPYRDLA